MGRKLVWASVLTLLAAVVGLGAFRAAAPDPPAAAYNVILVSIDTLRADHLGCYGHPAAATPNIDRLAAEGVLFEQCTAVAPLTLPSHASMLTGLDPYVHNARDNGHFYLHEDNVTLAERLKAAGYVTLAEVAAYVLNREYGLAQGFDVYHDVVPDSAAIGLAERRGDAVCGAALELLARRRDERFFLFLHLYDPHFPYEPPAPFADAHADPYLGEIAFVDSQVGRLMDGLVRLGLDRTTMVVLVADHGEARGEHGEQTHGVHVFDATQSVPMIWWAPGQLPAGRRLAMQVRLTDLAPTILDLLGLPPLPVTQGVSLLPQMRGSADDPGLPAYSEAMMPYHNWGYAPPRAVRRDGWKYIHARRPHLYHVATDPAENHNLADAQPLRVAQMRAELERVIHESPTIIQRFTARRQASPDDLELLRALGYAGGDAPPDDGAPPDELTLLDLVDSHPDPHEHADEIDRMQVALRHVMLGEFAAAERVLREVIALRGPAADMPWVYANLGLALARQGRHADAVEPFRRALALQPDNGTTLTNFGLSLVELGSLEEAAAVFERAVRIRPTLPMTHEAYALALYRLARIDEAVEQLRCALRIAPEATATRARLARLLLEGGRPAEALPDLQVAVEAQPDVHELRELLAEAYRRADRPAAALAELRKLVELAPSRAPAWRALASAQMQAAQWPQAADALRRAVEADPQNSGYMNDLAWLLATCPDAAVRDGAAALRLARRARSSRPGDDANTLDTLAAAWAELGRFAEAIEAIDEAILAAESAGDEPRIARLKQRRAGYARGAPYRLGR